MKLLHPLVHQFVKRTNTAAAVPHKIFIHNTCFIIRIDPLSCSAPPRRWDIDLWSDTQAKPWRQTKSWKWISIDAVKLSFCPVAVLWLQLRFSASGPRVSLSVTADRRWHNNVSVRNWCWRAEIHSLFQQYCSVQNMFLGIPSSCLETFIWLQNCSVLRFSLSVWMRTFLDQLQEP